MKVQSLFIYPFKSAAGLAVSRAELGPRGFRGDREWMAVDPQGLFLSQRTHPKLALLSATLTDAGLRLNEAVTLPWARSAGERIARVWNDDVRVEDAGDEAAEFLSDFLGASCRVVRQCQDDSRKKLSKTGHSAPLSFVDGYPFLIATVESLAALNQRLEAPVTMERFRPNIVLEGAAPFEEDRWEALTVGAIPFHVTKPCDRCSIVNVDPRTGVGGLEPLRTLATFRRDGNKVLFAVNAYASENAGSVDVNAEATCRYLTMG